MSRVSTDVQHQSSSLGTSFTGPPVPQRTRGSIAPLRSLSPPPHLTHAIIPPHRNIPHPQYDHASTITARSPSRGQHVTSLQRPRSRSSPYQWPSLSPSPFAASSGRSLALNDSGLQHRSNLMRASAPPTNAPRDLEAMEFAPESAQYASQSHTISSLTPQHTMSWSGQHVMMDTPQQLNSSGTRFRTSSVPAFVQSQTPTEYPMQRQYQPSPRSASVSSGTAYFSGVLHPSTADGSPGSLSHNTAKRARIRKRRYASEGREEEEMDGDLTQLPSLHDHHDSMQSQSRASTATSLPPPFAFHGVDTSIPHGLQTPSHHSPLHSPNMPQHSPAPGTLVQSTASSTGPYSFATWSHPSAGFPSPALTAHDQWVSHTSAGPLTTSSPAALDTHETGMWPPGDCMTLFREDGVPYTFEAPVTNQITRQSQSFRDMGSISGRMRLSQELEMGIPTVARSIAGPARNLRATIGESAVRGVEPRASVGPSLWKEVGKGKSTVGNPLSQSTVHRNLARDKVSEQKLAAFVAFLAIFCCTVLAFLLFARPMYVAWGAPSPSEIAATWRLAWEPLALATLLLVFVMRDWLYTSTFTEELLVSGPTVLIHLTASRADEIPPLHRTLESLLQQSYASENILIMIALYRDTYNSSALSGFLQNIGAEVSPDSAPHELGYVEYRGTLATLSSTHRIEFIAVVFESACLAPALAVSGQSPGASRDKPAAVTRLFWTILNEVLGACAVEYVLLVESGAVVEADCLSQLVTVIEDNTRALAVMGRVSTASNRAAPNAPLTLWQRVVRFEMMWTDAVRQWASQSGRLLQVSPSCLLVRASTLSARALQLRTKAHAPAGPMVSQMSQQTKAPFWKRGVELHLLRSCHHWFALQVMCGLKPGQQLLFHPFAQIYAPLPRTLPDYVRHHTHAISLRIAHALALTPHLSARHPLSAIRHACLLGLSLARPVWPVFVWSAVLVAAWRDQGAVDYTAACIAYVVLGWVFCFVHGRLLSLYALFIPLWPVFSLPVVTVAAFALSLRRFHKPGEAAAAVTDRSATRAVAVAMCVCVAASIVAVFGFLAP